MIDIPQNSPSRHQRFIEGGGDMGNLVRDYDWTNSPLGPISEWPKSLLSALGIVLHSGFPMFLFWGPDLISFYNDAYRPSLGNKGKHPAIGKPGREVWSDIWDFVEPIIYDVIETRQPKWFENQLVPFFRNNKTENIYWTFSHSPVFDDAGNVGGVLVTCMETTENVRQQEFVEKKVTERTLALEQAQQSLKKANEYLQEIINLFREPLQVLEPVIENGTVVDFKFKITNAAYSAYANATPDQLRGKRVSEVFPGYLGTTSFIKPAETFQTGQPDTWEIHYAADGLNLYNLMSATKLGEDVVLHFTDFTKLKLLQLELLEKINLLERSNENLLNFTHAISHDLKEPLRKIQFFANQFEERNKSLGDEILKPLEKIQRSAQYMRDLIDDLLTFSELNDESLVPETVDLNECLTRAIEALEEVIERKGAVISSMSLPTVDGYGTQLCQMIQNLLSNSIKYAKEGLRPEITIKSGTEDHNGKEYVSIEIQDNGIGFDQKYADQIFKIFSRLHDKHRYSGNGIGLSLVKKIVDNHEGFIFVTSAVSIGSTFKILLQRKILKEKITL